MTLFDTLSVHSPAIKQEDAATEWSENEVNEASMKRNNHDDNQNRSIWLVHAIADRWLF